MKIKFTFLILIPLSSVQSTILMQRQKHRISFLALFIHLLKKPNTHNNQGQERRTKRTKMYFGGVYCILLAFAAIGTLNSVLADTSDLNSRGRQIPMVLNGKFGSSQPQIAVGEIVLSLLRKDGT